MRRGRVRWRLDYNTRTRLIWLLKPVLTTMVTNAVRILAVESEQVRRLTQNNVSRCSVESQIPLHSWSQAIDLKYQTEQKRIVTWSRSRFMSLTRKNRLLWESWTLPAIGHHHLTSSGLPASCPMVSSWRLSSSSGLDSYREHFRSPKKTRPPRLWNGLRRTSFYLRHLVRTIALWNWLDIANPIALGLVCFFSFMTITEGGGRRALARKFQDVYIPTLKANFLIWPAVQVLNFRVVPIQFQIVSFL